MAYKDYYDGVEAQKIRQVVMDEIIGVVVDGMAEKGHPVGEKDGEVEIYKSGAAAIARFQDKEPFVFIARRPVRNERVKVLGHDDDQAHSGRKMYWSFVIQCSAGKNSGEWTDEMIKEADDEMIDEIRDIFETRYRYFREKLHFMDMSIAPADEPTDRGGVNPLILTFYNYIRMPVDEFGYTPYGG